MVEEGKVSKGPPATAEPISACVEGGGVIFGIGVPAYNGILIGNN